MQRTALPSSIGARGLAPRPSAPSPLAPCPAAAAMAPPGSHPSVSVLPVTSPQQLAQFREVTRQYLVSAG